MCTGDSRLLAFIMGYRLGGTAIVCFAFAGCVAGVLSGDDMPPPAGDAGTLAHLDGGTTLDANVTIPDVLSIAVLAPTHSWTVGVSVSLVPVTGSGGTPPYTYSMAPTLPDGLRYDETLGNVTGTPTAAVGERVYTVTVRDAAGMTVNAAFRASVASPSIAPLPALPYPAAGLLVDGGGRRYDGTTPLVWNGNVMLGPTLDPMGSGRTVNIHRIMESAPFAWGTTHRSELLWESNSEYALPPAQDTWQAFAVMRLAEENLPESTTDDSMLVFQSHSPEPGDTYPPYALFMSRQGEDHLRWVVSYNSQPVSEWPTAAPAVEGTATPHEEPLMPEGVWFRYVVHYRGGYLASHNPLLEVWRARPGEPFQHLFTHTGLNAYQGGDAYPRIGPYKWDGQWRGQTSLAFCLTPIYYGRGVDLFDRAAAALEGL